MADNIISPSKKEIYTKLLDIAEKYTDIKDSDFLKTGLFGYITESMAMMMRDSSYHKSMIYNENFLNTAIIPKSVYNWAKMFNVEVQKATPSYAKITLSMNKETLKSLITSQQTLDANDAVRYGTDVNSGAYVILNKEDPIIAGDYYFSLEHSILLKMTDDENITARYITSEYKSTDFQNISGKTVLPVFIEGDNVNIVARAYQYRTVKLTTQIPASTFLNKIQTYQFEDQFCGAVLFYSENGVKNQVSLKYSDLDTSTATQAAFYNLTDEHELQLIFKSGDNLFMPAANSTLSLYIYTTKGKNVPSSFTGDGYFLTTDSRIKSMPIIVNFTPTNIIGGKNSPTLTEIKKTIIDAISTRNTITTQSDLNNYFSILTSLVNDINNGKIKFIKQRDDIIERLYNAYLLLRDNTNDVTSEAVTPGSGYLSPCVPTNTIDVTLSDNIQNIDSATSEIYVMQYSYPTFDINGTYKSSGIVRGEDEYYVCPFAIYVVLTPFRAVKYIYNMADSVSNLIYYSNDNNSTTSSSFAKSNYYMVPVSIELKRGFKESSYEAASQYQLKIVTTTNFALDYCSDSNTSVLVSGGKINISGLSGSLKISSYDCSSESSGDGIFTTTIVAYINVADNEFGYVNSESEKSFEFGSAINLYGEDINTGTAFYDKENIAIDLSEFTVDSKAVGNQFISETPLVFFTNLDNIMKSDITVTTKTENDNEYITGLGLREVPVVHSSFFQGEQYSETRKDGFVNQLFTYITVLKENLEKLETNTFFNIKFYNTYGTSVLYNTNNVNLDLQLLITLKPEYTGLEYTTLRNEIRAYIRKLVDTMNTTMGGFSVSTLYSSLLSAGAYGQYISNIQFLGLNGTFEQVISPTGVEEDIGYPPEWLNISAESLANNITFNTNLE